jgi:phosphate-selective porin OprO and OprP
MSKIILSRLAAVLAALTPAAFAGPEVSVPAGKTPLTVSEDKEKTLAESLDNLGLLYKNKENPILQEFWLLGRYHGHYHDTDGSNGADAGWEDRRARFGFQAKFFENLTIHAQAIAGSNFEPEYNGFSELWAKWQFSEALNLTVGQQKHRFTHERNVSSRYMNYMERSMFTNMMGLDYTPAVTLSGKVDKWEYYTGVFSNATGTDMGDAFTELDSGWSFISSASYDLGDFLGADKAHFYGSYLHSDANDEATNLTRFDNAVSGALILTQGSASLVTELTAGFGGERGDAIGFNIQPGYFLTDKLQVVARYQLAAASEDNGLSSQRRYERPAVLPNGDFYQAAYLGMNYYLAGHRAKITAGVEYAKMNDEDALTLFAGFRMYFGPHSNAPFPGNKMLKGHW